MEKNKTVVIHSIRNPEGSMGEIRTPEYALAIRHGQFNQNLGKSRIGSINRNNRIKDARKKSVVKGIYIGGKHFENKRFGGYRIPLI